MTREQAAHMRFIRLHIQLEDVRVLLAQPQNSIDFWKTLRETEIYLEDEIEHMEAALFPGMKKAAGQGDSSFEHKANVLSSSIPTFEPQGKEVVSHA